MRILSFTLLFACCAGSAPEIARKLPLTPQDSVKHGCNPVYTACALKDRFCSPEAYVWINYDSGSFAYYLSRLPLKPAGSLVRLFDGRFKDSGTVYKAVVDMDISPRDLQQCADAVMRLRGEYLYAAGRHTDIRFRFLGDGKMHAYTDYAGTDRTYRMFRKYMDHVFNFANTASLKKQLKPVSMENLQAGDVFIQSGNPYGHAVLVVAVCVNEAGSKKYMLAQSYMPAQETQILLNPEDGSVWYNLDAGGQIQTPEWTFYPQDLMRW